MSLEDEALVIEEGETLQLSCSYSASPSPDIHWNRSDTRLNDSYPRITIDTNTTTTTLTKTGILASEGGLYTCYAMNEVGIDSATTNVSVAGEQNSTKPPVKVFKFLSYFSIFPTCTTISQYT